MVGRYEWTKPPLTIANAQVEAAVSVAAEATTKVEDPVVAMAEELAEVEVDTNAIKATAAAAAVETIGVPPAVAAAILAEVAREVTLAEDKEVIREAAEAVTKANNNRAVAASGRLLPLDLNTPPPTFLD